MRGGGFNFLGLPSFVLVDHLHLFRVMSLSSLFRLATSGLAIALVPLFVSLDGIDGLRKLGGECSPCLFVLLMVGWWGGLAVAFAFFSLFLNFDGFPSVGASFHEQN